MKYVILFPLALLIGNFIKGIVIPMGFTFYPWMVVPVVFLIAWSLTKGNK